MKWFQHDVGARNDIRLKRLQKKFGNDGYATYFKILEMTGEEEAVNGIDMNKYPLEDIAEQCLVTPEKVQEIIGFMVDLELFSRVDIGRGVLYNEKFAERADNYSKYGKQKGVSADLEKIRQSEVYKFCSTNSYFSTIKNLDEFLNNELQIHKNEAWMLKELKSLAQWLVLKPRRRFHSYALFIHRNLKRGAMAGDNRKAIGDLFKTLAQQRSV